VRAVFKLSHKPETPKEPHLCVPAVDPHAPTSTVLRNLMLRAPDETVTLGWLINSLGDRSFGILILLLGVLACVPGASGIAGIVIAFLACQMIIGRHAPMLPRFISARTFKKKRFVAILNRVIPVLRFIERFIRRRWQTPLEITKRLIGAASLLISALLFAPIPLSNLPPALALILLSFAYVEEDGLLLCIAVTIVVALLLLATVAIWEAMSAAGWVGGLI